MNIIIYDDDKRIWQLCTRYIEESGRYSISLSTDSYEEVVAYARQNMKPRLYILDIVIGDMITSSRTALEETKGEIKKAQLIKLCLSFIVLEIGF